MILKFSKSRYSTQKDCLGKYYFTYIKGIRDNTLWPGTLAGTTLHLYLEENYPSITSLKDIRTLPSFTKLYEKVKTEEITAGSNYKRPHKFNEDQFLNLYEKFLDDIFRFLFLYLPKGDLLFEENRSDRLVVSEVELEINGIIDLQVVSPDGVHIVDFKSTKNNANWYFLDWEHDPQSLSYYYLLRERNPLSFAYTIFNVEAKTIITQNNVFHPEYEERFLNILHDFVIGHQHAEDKSLWKPTVQKCKWCHANRYCTQKSKVT